jgi:hypothetical protein
MSSYQLLWMPDACTLTQVHDAVMRKARGMTAEQVAAKKEELLRAWTTKEVSGHCQYKPPQLELQSRYHDPKVSDSEHQCYLKVGPSQAPRPKG